MPARFTTSTGLVALTGPVEPTAEFSRPFNVQADAEYPIQVLGISEAPQDAGVDDLLGWARVEVVLDTQAFRVAHVAPEFGHGPISARGVAPDHPCSRWGRLSIAYPYLSRYVVHCRGVTAR
jgi:hypothetical protein